MESLLDAAGWLISAGMISVGMVIVLGNARLIPALVIGSTVITIYLQMSGNSRLDAFCTQIGPGTPVADLERLVKGPHGEFRLEPDEQIVVIRYPEPA